MRKLNAFIRLSVILGLAVSAGACQTLASLDPTGLLSDDSTPPAGQFPDAAAPVPPPSDVSAGTTPDLAGIPARPAATPPAQQQQVAQSLAADGAQVQYSADALRAGNEPSAPAPGPAGPAIVPPPAPPPAAAQPQYQTSLVGSGVSDAPAVGNGRDEPPTASPPAARAPAARAPAVAARTAPINNAAVAPRASGGEPAVPAVAPGSARANVAVASALPPSDAALGFRPSAAPPLDPSVSQFVAEPVIARYRQTAANARIGSVNSSAAVPGAVTGGPTAIVYFPSDGTALSAAARQQVRSAVAAFKASGGSATIRVVGHSSSRTSDMPLEAHMATIFDKSQKRADAVAEELIHQGVPAAKVQVEAVGDSQPVYYESMPKGEEGNRRAEIFVQN